MSKEIPNKRTDIAWNLDRKKEKEAAQEVEKAKLLIGHLFESFKAELCAKSRKHSEITQALHKFKEDLMKQEEYLKSVGLGDFARMSIDIAEAKVSQLIAARISGGNRITQHTPATEKNKGAIAKSAPFKTKEELLAIDFVKHFSEQPGFTGFSWKRVEKRDSIEFYLLASYATNDEWLVGMMPSDFALDDLPEYHDKEAL